MSIARSPRVQELIDQLAIEEKIAVVTGEGIWTTHEVERLNIPRLVVTDGPNGARGAGLMGTGTPTACIPAGSVLGATWDPQLITELGDLLGIESRAKGAHVLLAPTINLHRNMLGGRNFECYSEDPFLTGVLAASFVSGVQSHGVAVTAKHLVANDSEFERNTIDVQVDERTLREVYLLPFEHAVRNGKAWGIMSAYNLLNGTYCSEHEWLLKTVLRDEWGFDGFVVSDWFALRSTGPSVAAGLSLEMPGPGNWYGDKIHTALDDGSCTIDDLDLLVGDMLAVLERTGAFDGLGGESEKPLDRPQDRALIRKAGAAGTVLIRNDGILPLDPTAVSSIAVIGPNAINAKVMGGGSAGVRAYREISPLEAITDRLGDHAEINFAQGCDIDRSIPPLGAPLMGAMTIEFFNGQDFSGDVINTTTADKASMTFFGEPAAGVSDKAFSARLTGTFTAAADGEHQFSMVQCGRARVLLDGEVIIDGTEGDFETGDDYFGFGSVEIDKTVTLTKGSTHEIALEYNNADAVLLAGCRLGVVVHSDRDLLAEAEAAAKAADIAIVVVGTNDDWETEGRDRDQFALPGDQPELIRRVSAANPRTIVVVNTGGPHQLDWLDLPAATLSVGFGGQELGDSLVDVLTGEADPGGRMNTTIPQRIEHSPSHLSYPGENSVVRYAEGLFIGHRWFDARHLEPAVPFGHGLSYATFTWGEPQVSGGTTTSIDEPVVVEVEVTNTSERAGSDVVQLYVEPPSSKVQRPIRELKGFAKVHLGSGESTTVRIELDHRAFAYYDQGDQWFAEAISRSPVPAGGADIRHTEPGWYVEPGRYALVVARSSTDHATTVSHVLSGDDSRSAI